MSLPRLIATDLDGTFLSPDTSISETNRAAVARAHAEGIPVVFATGRPPTWLGVIDDVQDADDRVIAANGAVLIHAKTREIIEDYPLEADVAHSVASDLREVLPGVKFAVQQHFAFGYEEGFATEAPASLRGRMFAGQLDHLIAGEPFIKLLARHTDMGAIEMARRARPAVGDRLTVTFSMSDDYGLLELSAPGVTKAHALERFAASLGIGAADVAAFGDMPNDRAMLQWAGHAHVMGNAHPDLDDVDARRIGTNGDDAVGRTILSWFD